MNEIFSKEDYQQIKNIVFRHGKFNIKRKIKDFNVDIKDSAASCDFYKDYTKKGDYIILLNWNRKDGGGGSPICQCEFNDIFGSYEKFTIYTNQKNPYWKKEEGINGFKIKEVKGLDQLTLF
jgi:hypothetical protein